MSSAEVLQSPASWQAIDFISDLHLQASQHASLQVLQSYLASTPADALCILGDLFEVWVGDDALEPGSFEQQCTLLLQQAGQRLRLYFMPGNRDFLLGPAALHACGAHALHDPTVLVFGHQRWLLTHGDALCLDDAPYMAFRAQVRNAPWQSAFLARPLAERKALASEMRAQSEARKTGHPPGSEAADANPSAALQWLLAARCQGMIHGHTHRPADHVLHDGAQRLQRVVLSDWDGTATPPRAQALRLTASGLQRIALA